MKLKKLEFCRWMKLFLGLLLLECIDCGCKFPKKTIANGRYVYASERDAKRIWARELYVLSFRCFSGYKLVGPSSIKCMDGEWTDEVPFCERILCSDPPEIENGIYELYRGVNNLPTIGAMATYSCETGYNLEDTSAANLVCVLDSLADKAVWSGIMPFCQEMLCSDPPEIANGTYEIYLGLNKLPTMGAMATYYCETGYELEDTSAANLLCILDSLADEAVWSGKMPSCQEMLCTDPPKIANGTYELYLGVNNVPRIGAVATYSCETGYDLEDTSAANLICILDLANKTVWSGKVPSCQGNERKTCPDPGVSKHGSREGDCCYTGNTLRFLCEDDYDLVGDEEIFCLSSGRWSSSRPLCKKRKTCPDPGVSKHGNREGNCCFVGNSLLFFCDENYELIGDEEILCLSSGRWSADRPLCKQRKTCPDPGVSKHASREGKCCSAGNILRFLCEEDYELVGEEEILCLSSGRWSSGRPLCKQRKTCPDPGVSEHGSREGDCCFAGNILRFFCEEDYELVGYEEIFCLSSGRWSSDCPLCKRKVNMGGKSDTETELKKAGEEIYCIAVTGDMRVDSLYKSASSSEVSSTSHEKRPNVFILKNYDSMLSLIQDIKKGATDYSQCGLGREDIRIENESRILGGEQYVKPWPWMAALYYYIPGSRSIDALEFISGGSIINENFILTSAYSMYLENSNRLRDKEEITVKLGLTDLKNKTWVQDFKVQKIHIHPEYEPQQFDYDIALLQLDRPIQFTAYIRPVCLPPKELPPKAPFYKDNEYGWTIGWGYNGTVNRGAIHLDFSLVDTIQQIRVPIQSRETCTSSLINKHINTDYFTERMFCAGDRKHGIFRCKGAGGDPVIQSWTNPEGYIYWTQVGIVSWYIACGMENTYSYFTHVHSLQSWIEEIINGR